MKAAHPPLLPALAACLLLALPARGGELGPAETQVLQGICASCHSLPGGAVPQIGDLKAWAPRREKGMETLLRNTVNGYRGMPPLGTCGACTETELRRLIAVLAGLPVPEPGDGAAPTGPAR